MLKIKSNKGITILEIIIALSISSIVIFIGYRVINGISSVTRHQSSVSKIQQSINLVNKYVTEDLKYYSVSTFNELNELELKSNNYFYEMEDIKYELTKTNYTDYDTYTLKRIDNSGVTIELIKDQVINEGSIPFTISKKNESMYTVQVVYSQNTSKSDEDKIFTFDISSRKLDTDIDGDSINWDGRITIYQQGGSALELTNNKGEKYQDKDYDTKNGFELVIDYKNKDVRLDNESIGTISQIDTLSEIYITRSDGDKGNNYTLEKVDIVSELSTDNWEYEIGDKSNQNIYYGQGRIEKIKTLKIKFNGFKNTQISIIMR